MFVLPEMPAKSTAGVFSLDMPASASYNYSLPLSLTIWKPVRDWSLKFAVSMDGLFRRLHDVSYRGPS